MSQSTNLPPYAVVVTHPVADWESWKEGFDDHEPVRREAGMLGHHINRAEHDPNVVSIYLAVDDLEKAKAFADAPELAEVMERVGVTGPPEIQWMRPLRENVDWDRELPAFIISHRVADVDAWLEGYDQAGELQRSNGIVGHAANQSLDDPSVVVVYHQAESFDTLRSFLDQPDLKEAMNQAGVVSEPEVSFHTGGWGKRY